MGTDKPEPVEEDGCCMAILKSAVSVCTGHEVRAACEDRTSCYWMWGENADCEWIDDSDSIVDDRDLNKKLSDLLADGDSIGVDPIVDEELEEEELSGCCAGSTERTTALCNIVPEENCEFMSPCSWRADTLIHSEIVRADCSWPPVETEVVATDSAHLFVFGGGSGIGSVMDTRL